MMAWNVSVTSVFNAVYQIYLPVYLIPLPLKAGILSRTSMIMLLVRNPTYVSVVPQNDAVKRRDIRLRIVMHVLSCQSIKTGGKPAQLNKHISSLQADIIIWNESWSSSLRKLSKRISTYIAEIDHLEIEGESFFLCQAIRQQSARGTNRGWSGGLRTGLGQISKWREVLTCTLALFTYHWVKTTRSTWNNSSLPLPYTNR